MRYVQGRSLEQVIQAGGPAPAPDRALDPVPGRLGAHLRPSRRVIHRDIKPANILIDEDGNAVVTDFGIAKAAERPSQTQTGALVGTPAYMSPEQCSGGEVSGASDQYALGAVAYEMITGAPPFAGSTLTVMQAHVERAPPPDRASCAANARRSSRRRSSACWQRTRRALAQHGGSHGRARRAPLADDDPLRAELSRHAAPGRLARHAPPTSPAPRTGRRRGRCGRAGRSAASPSCRARGLEAGDSFMLVAVIRGEQGTRLPPRAVDWTTDTPRRAAGGRRDGGWPPRGTGDRDAHRQLQGRHRLLRVEVAPPTADEIVIAPVDEPLRVGDEIRLEATPRDKRGWPVIAGHLALGRHRSPR